MYSLLKCSYTHWQKNKHFKIFIWLSVLWYKKSIPKVVDAPFKTPCIVLTVICTILILFINPNIFSKGMVFSKHRRGHQLADRERCSRPTKVPSYRLSIQLSRICSWVWLSSWLKNESSEEMWGVVNSCCLA